MKNRIYLESLGCAKNLVDSEVMLGCLAQSGCRFTSSPDEAEIIIINTCSFIEDAARESIDTILLLAEQKKKGACKYLVVSGCLPQRYKEELINALPEVDLFLGTGEFQKIVPHLENLTTAAHPQKLRISGSSFLVDPDTPRIVSTPGASAYLKISEGCSHHCTYCTIPAIRGPYNPRSRQSIIREAQHLAGQGIKELNLISQDTTRYKNLAELLRELVNIPGLTWIRLLYCHPANLTAEVINVMAAEEKVCSYIDLPLQHISDPILKRMGRRITRKETETLLRSLRRAVPGLALRTTLMVGFPGETDNDFENLLNFVAEFQFDHLGVFQYQDEEGTPACKLTKKIPKKTKKDRYHHIMRLQSRIAKEKNRTRLGTVVTVLVEGKASHKKYLLQGRAEFQGPEVDGVIFINENMPVGSLHKVQLQKVLSYDLVGTLV